MTTQSSPNSTAPLNVDVAIIGGGPVGGLIASVLAQAGLQVALIEAEKPEFLSRPASDGRAIAVAFSAQRALMAGGLWPQMEPHAQPILDIRVTDGASPLYLQYDHTMLGDDPLGWIVENEVIKAATVKHLAKWATLHLLAPARVTRWTTGPGAAILDLADGRQVRAALMVGADGRPSPTRVAAGIGLRRWDYHQSAIVCAIAHERPHNGTAHEHFMTAGPFAILPMTGNRSGIVWTEHSQSAPAIIAQDDEEFLAELTSRTGNFLGEITLDGPRFAYPLTLQIADRIIGPRLALVGDAAQGMHPIAGQGMNVGIRDVAALSECIIDARRLGLDPGGPAVLERYQRWRRLDTMMMLAVTDGLNRLFSNDIGPLKLARDLGMAALNHIPSAKRLLMRHAMGVVGDLPKLLKGERP